MENNLQHHHPSGRCHRGVYTLIIHFTPQCCIKVGKRIRVVLPAGSYLYNGSAMGCGSTCLESRIERHLRRDKNKFWHIDRILAHSSAQIASIVLAKATGKAECRVNSALLREEAIRVPQQGIGSSDCECESHFLAAGASLGSVQRRVVASYFGCGLIPHVFPGPLWRRDLLQGVFEKDDQRFVDGHENNLLEGGAH